MLEIAGQQLAVPRASDAQRPYPAEGKPIGMNAIVVMDYPLN